MPHPITLPESDLPELGQPLAGGILAAVGYRQNGTKYALVTACKETGESKKKINWNDAMEFCAALGEGWKLPSLENATLLRANCMPGTYVDFPAQTQIDIFKQGGPEAFETDDWYWTGDEASADFAWVQLFDLGGQGYGTKGNRWRVRAVREIDLI
ncbi:MAG: hypothetical protein WC722_05820 [Rhodospirillales bacterium]|jgi:hypothetical protein